MAATLKMSSKGQVVVPSAMRRRHGWTEGSEIEAIDVAAGVMLRVVPAKTPGLTIHQALEQIWARSPGPSARVSDEDIDRALIAEAARQDLRTRP